MRVGHVQKVHLNTAKVQRDISFDRSRHLCEIADGLWPIGDKLVDRSMTDDFLGTQVCGTTNMIEMIMGVNQPLYRLVWKALREGLLQLGDEISLKCIKHRDTLRRINDHGASEAHCKCVNRPRYLIQ